MKLSVFAPENPLLDGEPVRQIQAPSVRGELGILPGHAALITLLQAGILRYLPKSSPGWRRLAVGWGYLEISPPRNGETDVRVLAESAETKETLDRAKAERELQAAEKELARMDLEPAERERLKRERLRLESELNV